MINIINSFLPGIREFYRGEFFSALLQLLPVVIIAIWWHTYLDTAVGLALLAGILASNFYRDKYACYWRTIKLKFFDDQQAEAEKAPAQLAVVAKAPWWWLPVINWNWMVIIAVFAAIHALITSTQVSFVALVDGWPVVLELCSGLLNPEWSLLEEAIYVYARQTIEVALLGTAVGFLLALPISFFCAQNLMFGSLLGRSCYFICRSIMVVVRAIPTFLLGLIFVALVGLGPFPGVLAITVFSAGVMVKLFSEAIEAADNGIAEAIYACGGSWINMVVFGILPQIVPVIVAQLLYCMEINVHSATVLGLIGAEGIGLPIHEYLSALAYDRAAVFIFITIVMTVAIDYGSAYVRKKII
jgi:phosphonate transport system permease protein